MSAKNLIDLMLSGVSPSQVIEGIRPGRSGENPEDYDQYDGLLGVLDSLVYKLTKVTPRKEWPETTQYIKDNDPDLYKKAEETIHRLEQMFH